MVFSLKGTKFKKNTSTYCAIFLLFINLIIMTGCSNAEIYMDDSSLNNKIIKISPVAQELDSFPFSYYYFPEVAEILDGNKEGELIGFIKQTESLSSSKVPVLYIIDPIQQIATKIIEPQAGFLINRASFDNQWIVWVERKKDIWKMYAFNRFTQEKKMLDEGQYFKAGGDDYPTPDIYEGVVVYDNSINLQNDMDSKIIAYNLCTDEKTIINEINGLNQFLGPPKIYEDNVVWHRGEWTNDMNAKVYLYNLTDRKLNVLSGDNPGITPAIWGKNVVWNTFDKKSPETKNILLYNIDTGNRIPLTDATIANKIEFWGPSISYGIITWNVNFTPYKPIIYISVQGQDRILNIDAEHSRIFGCWLTWKQAKEDSGTCLLGFSTFFPGLDLTGSSSKKAITKSPLNIDDSLTLDKLASLSPPQAAALYLQALKEQRYDVVSTLLADDTGLVDKEDYLAGIKQDKKLLVSYIVSNDFFIEGQIAHICVLHMVLKEANGKVITNSNMNWHLTKQDGIWKVDQLAAQ